jgi:predicted dehydrogenase
LHLHDAAANYAMRKGKHVLTEKLMAHSVHQCKEMARLSEETGLILATGHQRHYSILYDNAVSQIRSGLLGQIHHIRAQWHRGNLPGSDSWSPPLPCPMMSEDDYVTLRREERAKGREDELRQEYKLLEELHSWKKRLAGTTGTQIEVWQKKVAQKEKQLEDYEIRDVVADYGYTERMLDELGRVRTPLEELIRWRLWDRTGGGLMAELGSHQLDAASIFLTAQREDHSKALPLSVTGVGGRHIFPADRDVDDHVYTTIEFPAPGYYQQGNSGAVADPNKKVVVTYSSINGNGFGGYGEVVLGTQGTLILERETDAMLFKTSDTKTKISVSEGKGGAVMNTYETGGGQALAAAATPTVVSRGYREEIEHWAWCIKNPSPENQPKCTPKVAMADAIIALTSNIAMRENRRIEFDPDWYDIKSDKTPEDVAPRATSELGKA